VALSYLVYVPFRALGRGQIDDGASLWRYLACPVSGWLYHPFSLEWDGDL